MPCHTAVVLYHINGSKRNDRLTTTQKKKHIKPYMSENLGISCPGSVIYAALTHSIGTVHTVKHLEQRLFQFDASRTCTRQRLKLCFLTRDCLSLMPFVTHSHCLCLLLLFCCRRRQPQPQPATYHFPLVEKSRRFPTSPIGPGGANFPGSTPVRWRPTATTRLLGCQVVGAIPCVQSCVHHSSTEVSTSPTHPNLPPQQTYHRCYCWLGPLFFLPTRR